MKNKWLLWGVLVFLISGFGWFVSIILNVVTFLKFRSVSNVLGVVAIASMPIAIILAIFNRKKL